MQKNLAAILFHLYYKFKQPLLTDWCFLYRNIPRYDVLFQQPQVFLT